MNKNLRLLFTGDFFPGNSGYSIGSGIASRFLNKGREAWAPNLKKYFFGSDIALINLESPLCSKDVHKNIYCGSPDFAAYLKDIGVTSVSIANNHILEHGIEGFQETVSSLKSQGIHVLGEVDEKGKSKILRQNTKGLQVAMASFNAVHDIENPACYAEYSKEGVLESIRDMQEKGANLIIIYLHWGNEYIHIPAPWQIEDAHAFIDAGADLIMGTHPHVIQPLEYYKEGIIFYSLGNFVFDMFDSEHVRVGLIAQIEIDENGSLSVDYDLIYIGDDSIPVLLREKKLKKYQIIMDRGRRVITELYNKNKKAYAISYEKERKYRRFQQRIRMKITLARNWKKLNPESKKYLTALWKKKIFKMN